MSRILFTIVTFCLSTASLSAQYASYAPMPPQQMAPPYAYPAPIMQPLQQQLFQSAFQTPNFIFQQLDDGNGWQGGLRPQPFPPQLQVPGSETTHFMGGMQNTNGQLNYWKEFPFPFGSEMFSVEFDLVIYTPGGMQNNPGQPTQFLVFANDSIISDENIFTTQYEIPLKFGTAYHIPNDPNRPNNNNMGRVYHYKLVFLKNPKTGAFDLLDRNALRTGVSIMPAMMTNPQQQGQPNSTMALKIGFGVQTNVGNVQFGISNFGISNQIQ